MGAHPTPQVVGVEELPGKSHYLLGNDPSQWRTNIPTYAKVKYREVYPGVDVLYYGNPRQLEYDVIVAPGAGPSVITLALTLDGTAGPDPAPALHLDATGDVVLTTAGGTLRLHQPVVSQEIAGVHHAIPCRYVLGPRVEGTGMAGGTQQLRVHVAAYDRSHPLLIDPVLSYSTYLGGSDDDGGFGIAVDGAGNAYVTGRTESANFPTTPGAVQPTPPGGSSNAFVSKLNATGTTFVYSTYLGGSGDDSGYGIAVDGTGNAYVTGGTTSADFLTTPGAVQPTLQDSYGDAFVSKFNATGTVLGYSTYLGGEHSDEGQGIAVDGTGTAYVTGLTYSTDFPTTPGAVQPTLGGRYHSDAFVTKLVLGLPSAPTLALTVNTPSVHKGDTLTLSALATPGPTSATADVYIVLQPPGCASFTCLLFWQGGLTFTATPQPLLRNWPISPFNGPIFRYTFDGTALAGPYVWVGAFAVPGTSTLMSGATQVLFTFSQ